MHKNLTITSLLGALAVVLGAFGAHVLKAKLSSEALQSFETGVRYQIYHVFALLIVNIYNGFSQKQKNKISYFFFAGIACFSGSIYAIYLLNIPAKKIWFVTPLGGVLFIIGWLLLAFSFYKNSSKNSRIN
ncbi:DUF423 domain-containing protein [Tenacibaculum sp. UWU-22]|uniref:DUF423 domain-containing protein n=1 Tax=Tenacibaculum sp. UWU-22 TaxID=3234187 RepID=UPI0034DABCF9